MITKPDHESPRQEPNLAPQGISNSEVVRQFMERNRTEWNKPKELTLF